MRRLISAALLLSLLLNGWLLVCLSRGNRTPANDKEPSANTASPRLENAFAAGAAERPATASEAMRGELARLRNENTTLQRRIRETTNTPAPLPFRRLPANATIDDKFRAATNALAAMETAAQEEYKKRSDLLSELVKATPEQLVQIKKRAESHQCIQNMKKIGLAARMYAHDNERFPTGYDSMRNEIESPEILFCPAAPGSIQARTWQQFSSGAATYPWRGTSADPRVNDTVLTVCPYHGHVGVSDGSVQMAPGQMPNL